MPVTLVSPVTTELQFDNAIQVEWFDKTLSESYFGLQAQSIDHYIFIQQGGLVVTQEHELDTLDTVVKRIQVHLVRNMS